MKPTIKVKEVFVDGAKVNWITGNNARYIFENGIDTGAVVEVIRSNRVIPKIKKVLERANVSMPMNSHWNQNGVELLQDEISDETLIKKIYYFFKTLDAKSLGPKTVENIYNAGFRSIKEFLNLKLQDLLKIPRFGDASSNKVLEAIRTSTTNADLATVLAAVSVCGEGFGVKKFQNILQKFPNFLDISIPDSEYIKTLQSIGGFAETAITFTKYRLDIIKFIDLHHEITYYNNPLDKNTIQKMEDIKFQHENEIKNNKVLNHDLAPLPISSSVYTLKDEFGNIHQPQLYIDNSSHNTEQKIESQSTIKRFIGKSIVFSGIRDLDLEQKIVAEGGDIKSAVSGKTNYLIVLDTNENSTKIKKAHEVNSKKPNSVQIIQIEEFKQEYYPELNNNINIPAKINLKSISTL